MKQVGLGFIILLAVALLCGCQGAQSEASAGGSDSLYTAERIQQIALDRPGEALALLDTAEVRNLFAPSELGRLRSLVYHNGLSHYKTAYAHALKAYNDPESRRDPVKFLSLLSLMADQCHYNGDYAASMGYCAEGLELAKKLGDKTIEAELNVTWGLNLLQMRQQDEAFQHIDLAISILKDAVGRDSGYHSWDVLFYALGQKQSLLCDNDMYRQALAMRPDMEEALQGLVTSKDTPEGCSDMRRAEMDVLFSCIAYTLGDKAEGDSFYRSVEANPYASTPDGEYIRIPCLILAKRYDEALEYIGREKALLKETTDTANWDYINPHLQSELEAYQGKGDWKSAARVQATMLALTDTLRHRERQADALELAEIYKSEEKDAIIEQQRDEIAVRRVVTGAVVLLLIAGACFAVIVVRKNRSIRRNNVALVARIKTLLKQQKELDLKINENLALRDRIEQIKKELDEAKGGNATEPITPTETDAELATASAGESPAEADRILFDRIACEIKDKRLYCNPKFSRADVLQLFPVSPNKFAGLFMQFAGMKFTAYVQNLRLEYAGELFIQHPDWSVDAVIKECGMSRTAFYGLFVRKFSMKPEEFRKNALRDHGNGR
ncbi:MAG TPA: helix-turn-helix domain-containing protein [Candidatus Amulumruptor caecigallinarius]|uniref:Helix-turn-helix domain-containing protein n=1 Tax=Candidatus Amulumruptor caecigallinarius TaxID=2109911 RepID=A0A921JJP9_9BACT|nr:helix-turn-helix domain-containing protein [Candidatus Amulumruptor caecigallinarius]